MKSPLRSPLTAAAVSVLSILALAPQAGLPASSAATPAATSDPCGATKSKWEHVKCQQYNASAPGDEYFGRLKISYLGIDNTFRDGNISAGASTTDPHLITKLMFADEALARWAAKYPGDPQLPRAYFLGVQVFRKVYTQPGQQTAWRYMQTLVKTYPTTYFGKTTKASLAKGFTEHWYADAVPCPTPLPKGAKPSHETPAPQVTATPKPGPGQPAVQILEQPCIPPTPSPSPSPEGTKSPNPAKSPQP